MARFNSRWLDVVLLGPVGVVATWHACSVLLAGKYHYSYHGQRHVFTPDIEPFWYWLWVTLFLTIGVFCLFRALRAGWEIIQVYRMDRRIEERERLQGEVETDPGRPIVRISRSVTVKTVGKDGQQQEYHSMAEVPPEIRSEIEALEAEAKKEKGWKSSSTETSRSENAVTSHITLRKDVSVYKIVDQSGVERIYHSLEEMPPEIRAAIEKAEGKSE